MWNKCSIFRMALNVSVSAAETCTGGEIILIYIHIKWTISIKECSNKAPVSHLMYMVYDIAGNYSLVWFEIFLCQFIVSISWLWSKAWCATPSSANPAMLYLLLTYMTERLKEERDDKESSLREISFCKEIPHSR